MSPEAEIFLSTNSHLIREAFLDMERENEAMRAARPDCGWCGGNGGFSTGRDWPFDWHDCHVCEGRGYVAGEAA